MLAQLYASATGCDENAKLIIEKKIVGKESAQVGQGKAFKEKWIRKDKDTLRVNVSIQKH